MLTEIIRKYLKQNVIEYMTLQKSFSVQTYRLTFLNVFLLACVYVYVRVYPIFQCHACL